MKIAKDFTFDAAHFLPLLHEGHKCRRLHGHTYRVTVVIEGKIDERGMVVDYDELDEIWSPIHDELDHRCLNDIEDLKPQPTTEVLALWVKGRLSVALRMFGNVTDVEVYVHESSSTRAGDL